VGKDAHFTYLGEITMGDLSKNFSRSEFACKCGCGFNTVDSELIRILQSFRDKIGEPITISSGCRCPIYNAFILGSENSQHMKGRAADIVTGNPIGDQQYFLKEYSKKYGIGVYDTFTHIDTRSGPKARWHG